MIYFLIACMFRGTVRPLHGFKRCYPKKLARDMHGSKRAAVWFKQVKRADIDAEFIKDIERMTRLFHRGSDTRASGYIKSYGFIVYDTKADEVIPQGFDDLSDEGYMFDGVDCSNKWLLEQGLPID
jgi:hypothetical protein